ncbi:MAG TPA: DMT family transporter [Gaiellaceae bacterium]|nr:DMT family transporter [Gaiellaceae bacterium]
MIAVLGGLGAAVCWATGTISAARASRMAGAWPVLGWVMLVGLLVAAPLAAAAGPHTLTAGEVGWMALSGAGNVGGLLLVYEAMRLGKVSVTAPITSTEGAIAAVLAVATGESLGISSSLLLAIIAVGVVLASLSGGASGAHPVSATFLAGGAALLFGTSLFATGRVSQSLPLAWALLSPRLVGVAAVTIPLLVRRRLRIPGRAAPFAALSGLCEVGGFASYAVGSRHAIAIAAVLASQFAALTVVASFVLFRERLRSIQLAGIAGIVVCVGLLTALRA